MLQRRDSASAQRVDTVDIVEKSEGSARLTRLTDVADVAEIVDLLARLKARRDGFEDPSRPEVEVDLADEGSARRG